MVFLRMTRTGSAIYFLHNGESRNGYLEVGIVDNYNAKAGYRYPEAAGRFYKLFSTDDIASRAANYRKEPGKQQTFTFGVAGFDVYAKLNGIEFLRFKEYRHMHPGHAAIQNNIGYGSRDIRVRHLSKKKLRSRYWSNSFNLADFGLRSIRVRGSIKAGSYKVRLSARRSFRVGDYVIVATGGENGRGKRGSVGVGGTWPSKAYPSLNAMHKDRVRPSGVYAWVEETGDVYRHDSAEWTPLAGAYYVEKAIPRALTARIRRIARNGKVLILDRPATTFARNAHVYLDNQPILQKMLRNPRFDGEMNDPVVTATNDLTAITPSNATWMIPRGSYAIGSSVILDRHEGWALQGAGRDATTLFSPRGAPSAMIWALFAPGSAISDLHVRGNARNNGFMLSGNPQFFSDMNVQQGRAYPSGILLGQESHGSRVERVRVTDVFQKAVGADYCNDCWARDVDTLMTHGLRDYIQWIYQWADSVGGGCIDCSLTSVYLVAGFEAFKSRNVQFIRPFGINAIVAMNSSGEFLIEDGTFIIERMSQHPDRAFSAENPIIGINSNIGNHPYLTLGGTIRDTLMRHEGYINRSKDILPGIVVNENNPNIVVEGGLYEAPDYRYPSKGAGARGLTSTGDNILVDGLRVDGSVRGAGIHRANIGFTSGVVRNCVADVVRTTSGAIVNCRTTGEADAMMSTPIPTTRTSGVETRNPWAAGG